MFSFGVRQCFGGCCSRDRRTPQQHRIQVSMPTVISSLEPSFLCLFLQFIKPKLPSKTMKPYETSEQHLPAPSKNNKRVNEWVIGGCLSENDSVGKQINEWVIGAWVGDSERGWVLKSWSEWMDEWMSEAANDLTGRGWTGCTWDPRRVQSYQCNGLVVPPLLKQEATELAAASFRHQRERSKCSKFMWNACRIYFGSEPGFDTIFIPALILCFPISLTLQPGFSDSKRFR